MLEFADRTHQRRPLADRTIRWAEAKMQIAAAPIRIEKWIVRCGDGIGCGDHQSEIKEGEVEVEMKGKNTIPLSFVYLISGLVWGGDEPTDQLLIKITPEGAKGVKVPVTSCQKAKTNWGWGSWYHLWQPTQKGKFGIEILLANQSLSSKRLVEGKNWYRREVVIDDVGFYYNKTSVVV
eukprot:TRINITY_DN8098_c0_g1_i1.p1 TRINITY_DN8098_c0_g1~~TRINITY_DN8098_c0_g1_i1.p1  ORF type:complete len:179 (-),score=35.03 TRINITY_DN8098_c0_g1_i1:161-697(-)